MRSFEKGKVSIVTPCYNGERFLDLYFDSLCTQSYDTVELIFVNDGSTDNSEKVCLSWKSNIEKRGFGFRYISQKTCKGATSAINQGLPFVTGEFLIWPDCDDSLMPTSIEKRVEFLNMHPDYAMVRSDYVSVDEESPEIIKERGSDLYDIKNEDIFDNLIFQKSYVISGCYMVRSSVFFERIPHGQICVKIRGGGQNWPILLPCSYKNKTGYIDEPLYTYIIHSDSVSQRIDGDFYSSRKNRQNYYHDILIKVINDFFLLSDDEKTNYLNRIELEYSIKRLDLALSYNCSNDAKIELQQLHDKKINPGITRKILYQLCYFGLSRYIFNGWLLVTPFLRKNIKKLLSYHR